MEIGKQRMQLLCTLLLNVKGRGKGREDVEVWKKVALEPEGGKES